MGLDITEKDSKIAICGLQRSGTNYLESILSKISSDDIVDKTFPKHSFTEEIPKTLLEKRSLILISRHPCLWLQSCMINSPADLTETKTEFFQAAPPEVAFAEIYSKFYREWLEYILKNGGSKIRYEQLLCGDFGEIRSIGQFNVRPQSGNRKFDTTIPRVPHSIEFTDADRKKELNRDCSLSTSTVNLFLSHIDKDIVCELGYKPDDITLNARHSARSIAYRILRYPHDVPNEDLSHLLEEANDTFNDNPKLCHAIGARIARGGDLYTAIHWHELAANAKSSDPNDTFAESCMIKLDALEQIVDLERKITKAHHIDDCFEIKQNATNLYKSAISDIKKLAENYFYNPKSKNLTNTNKSEILFIISDTLRRSFEIEESLKYIRKAIQIAPDHGRYHQFLGVLLLTDKCFEQSALALKRAIDLEPLDVLHRIYLSAALSGQERFEEALAQLTFAIDLEGPAPRILNQQGQVLGRLGRWDAAEAVLRRAAASEPADAFHRHLLSWALENQGRLAEAVHEAECSVGCENAEPWHWHHLGTLLMRQGRLGEAEAALRRTVLLDPADARHHFALSDVLERLGRLAEAVSEAEASLECANVEPWHFHHCGLLLAALGRLASAETKLREAIRAEPTQWRSHLELSCLLERQARIAEAVTAAEAAISAGGDAPRVHRQYGLLLARTGRLAEARLHLGRALQTAPRKLIGLNGTAFVYALCRLLTIAQPAK